MNASLQRFSSIHLNRLTYVRLFQLFILFLVHKANGKEGAYSSLSTMGL